ncbi:serine/threonine-protein kinase [Rubricoccus marinus]|uniref:serine/threonine-protein kinase n=1 Tax=Rubricoccus marinus TaxID=716817 RepID=UPI00117A9B7A|nr:serine/threonine-protein kinase [Rubricoccus marinus]
MTAADRHARATALFLDTADLAPAAREAVLGQETDPDVLASVRALLAGHDAPSGPLDEPAVTPLRQRPGAPLAEARVIGREVGPWRITGRLGQGGMGAVYLAERADGHYEREVALKLLAPDADLTSDWLALRLDAERRILARLEHPGIARLYDGGVTEDGLPYLAMERAHGLPITAFADARGLGVRERVALVAEVCDAVAYAHHRLVVHRDLKPSNILVASGEAGEDVQAPASGARGDPGGEDEKPGTQNPALGTARGTRVKLLDFGVASLLENGESDATQRRALTPAYAAPEQLRGETITTATDVYALGVVLYQLLTDQRPYGLSGTTASEAERIVCEALPMRPSDAAPEARRKAIRGDLDTIVMRALEKEPERRYDGAAALGADLRRHLAGLPVEARPATASYRFGRYVRRHKTLAAATLAVLLAVLGGAGLALWQAAEASRARDRAEERFAIAQEAAQAMLYDVHDAIAGLPGSTPARETIVERSLDYLDRLASGAGDDPRLRLDLAAAYFRIGNVQGNPTDNNLGRMDDAMASYRRGLALLPPLARVPDSLIVEALTTEARLHEKLGVVVAHAVSPEAAVPHLDRALAVYRRAFARASGDPDVTTYLATGHINRGDYAGHPYFPNLAQPDSAMVHYERARGLLESIPRDAETLFSLRMLGITFEREGTLLRDRGALDSAAGPTRRAIALRERIAARDDATSDARRDVGVSHEALGRLFLDAGNAPEAVRELQKAFDIYQSLYVADPESSNAQQTVAFGHLHLGRALAQAGRRADARRHLDSAVRLLSALAEREPGNARAESLVQEAREARAAVG